METVNLKVIYNHKNENETDTVTKQNIRTQFVKRLEIQVRNWYHKLELLGSAAGTAIRN
ncbi:MULTISPECIES: hypothetical protein [Aquimarina]|uniref:hypothetical protein n=1 Tax=Aquimarina TaxID=290174 RepID=UPI000B291810|nr:MULTISPECIES: hypothetical protein [Aquimarina]